MVKAVKLLMAKRAFCYLVTNYKKKKKKVKHYLVLLLRFIFFFKIATGLENV